MSLLSSDQGIYVRREKLERFATSLLSSYTKTQDQPLPETACRWLDRRYPNLADSTYYIDQPALTNFFYILIFGCLDKLNLDDIKELQNKCAFCSAEFFQENASVDPDEKIRWSTQVKDKID